MGRVTGKMGEVRGTIGNVVGLCELELSDSDTCETGLMSPWGTACPVTCSGLCKLTSDVGAELATPSAVAIGLEILWTVVVERGLTTGTMWHSLSFNVSSIISCNTIGDAALWQTGPECL